MHISKLLSTTLSFRSMKSLVLLLKINVKCICNSSQEATQADPRSSPTLSVRSLSVQPSSPRLARALHSHASSPGGMDRLQGAAEAPGARGQYIVAVHRKQNRLDAYFLPSSRSRPALFGVPLLVGLRAGMAGRDVYAQVWAQVARLLSARPPAGDACNHATDCDDSLGYEFPFTLRLVCARGAWCGRCAWPALCRGCALPTSPAPLVQDGPVAASSSPRGSLAGAAGAAPGASPIAQAKLQRQASARTTLNADGSSSPGTLSVLDLSQLRGSQRRGRAALLAIDWDPTALHLRYQSTREKAWVEHESVRRLAAEAAQAVDLASCLRAFTSAERLEQRYHCDHCRCKQPATKTLQLWRAPPILIVHLKRFQYVNNKWIKSQKVVDFPFTDFDPTEYLASVPKETILRHRELTQLRRSSMFVQSAITESESEDSGTEDAGSEGRGARPDRRRRCSLDARRRERLESSSLAATPVTADNLEDYHQHRLLPEQDPLDLRYRLYAVVSHSGQMSGGHYVAYARHPSGTWLCYNDSSCRELAPAPRPPIDPAAAYLLFYERQGLDYESYLPNIEGKEPVVKDSEALDPDESDLKKMCVIS